VTASHNPPEYNGYKVYGPLAAQITLPAEQEIAARMAGVGPAKRIARVTSALSGAAPGVEPIPPAMAECYLAELDALRVRPAAQALRIVYTPLHGVGGDLAGSALRRAGYTDLHVVAEQAEPDGRFPTVRFPNPEEPGALQLATALAERVGGDLILANDPDADRLAVSLPNATGRFAALTGNQIGVLLADYVLEHAARSPRPLVVSTIVSSPMLEAVAAERGAQLERTLTGFKWIWKAALELEARGGVRFVFGYEEALGYSIGHLVHDKDGISSAVVFADLVAHCRAAGQSPRERLEQLYRRHGLWVSAQRSLSRPGMAGGVAIQRAVDQLSGSPPAMLAGRRVTRIRDFRVGAEERPPWLGQSLLVELELEDQSRLLARPSGTEPKLKLYVDHRVALRDGDSLAEREAQALAQAHALADAALAYLGFADAL
jgi:phosphomannomutase